MPQSKFPTRTPLTEGLRIAVTVEEKQHLFELAAKREKSASELIREATKVVFFSEQRAA